MFSIMTHIGLGVSLGLSLQLLLGGSLQTTDGRGEETAGDHGSHFVGSELAWPEEPGGCDVLVRGLVLLRSKGQKLAGISGAKSWGVV